MQFDDSRGDKGNDSSSDEASDHDHRHRSNSGANVSQLLIYHLCERQLHLIINNHGLGASTEKSEDIECG